MQKDFSGWFHIKQDINNFGKRQKFQEREVRWCCVGLNVGCEIDGKGRNYSRPVLILKKLNRDACLCLPVSTKGFSRKDYYPITLNDGLARNVILSQVRFIDARRLRDSIGELDSGQFELLRDAVKKIFSKVGVIKNIVPSLSRGVKTQNEIPGHGGKELSLPGSVDPIPEILPNPSEKSKWNFMIF